MVDPHNGEKSGGATGASSGRRGPEWFAPFDLISSQLQLKQTMQESVLAAVFAAGDPFMR